MYVIKNLRSLIKNNRLIFILLMVCVIVSTLVIQFSYGIYQNYYVSIQKQDKTNTEIAIEVNNSDDDYLRLSQLVDCVRTFSPNLYNGIRELLVGHNEVYEGSSDNAPNYLDTYICFDENGEFIAPVFTDEAENVVEGRVFTNVEWKNGDKVCIIGFGSGIQRVTPYSDENGPVFNIKHDGIVETNQFTDPSGDVYKVIGVIEMGQSIFPINAMNPDNRVDILAMFFKESLTKVQYIEIRDKLESQLGKYIDFPELDIEEPEQLYLYRTIIVICILVSVAAGINFIILFHFIMLKRRKKFGVFRLCGCSSFKCILMCLGECLTLSVPLYIISTAFYHQLIIPVFSDLYPHMESASSLKVYVIIGAVYIGITTLITLAMLIVNIARKSIISIRKGVN